MVPLIDCMFLLLTFFIYIATTMVIQRGIPVKLATAETGESTQKDPTAIHVSIKPSGEIYLEADPVSDEMLAQRLRTLARGGDGRPVVLSADSGVFHRRVVEVLDAIRQSGVSQVIFAVEPRGTKTP